MSEESNLVGVKAIANELNIKEAKVLELCEERRIPFEVIDEGTPWEMKMFVKEDVLTALKAKKKQEQKKKAAAKAADKE